MTAYDPLHDPATAPKPAPASLDTEVRLAREVLDETAGVSIHDFAAMVRAATGLDYRLRALVAAVEAERSEGR